MKKILSIAALALLISCNKTQLQPDPAPVYVAPEEKVDTIRQPLKPNDWICYQYKYNYNNSVWLMQTNWKIRLTDTHFMIDELNDGNFEFSYTYRLNAAGNELVVDKPDGAVTYEVRQTTVAKKPGYDLRSLGNLNQHVYSLTK